MWIWACVAPHPPIVVPEVGRGGEGGAKNTIQAFLDLGKALNPPELLVLLSPHAPFVPGKMLLGVAETYEGSFRDFGASAVALKTLGFPEALSSLETIFRGEKIPYRTLSQSRIELDHGCLVPLYYLSQFWQALPPLMVMNPAGLSPQEAYDAGRALAQFLPEKKWGLLASGDLSHGVTPSAPGRYHPWGKRFDQMVVASLEGGESLPLRNLSLEERRDAQECGLASVLCALGLAGDLPFSVLNYEAPFGVGYCVAYRKAPEEFLRHEGGV